MSNSSTNIPQLCNEYLNYMVKEKFALEYIRSRKHDLNILLNFMQESNENEYNASVCAEFAKMVYHNTQYSTDSIKRRIIKASTAFLEYTIYGYTVHRKKQRIYTYSGEIGACLKNYIKYRQAICAASTLAAEYLYLERFNTFLSQSRVKSLSQLNAEIVLSYVENLAKYAAATVCSMLSSLRNLLSWLYDSKLTSNNLSYIVPKSNYRRQAKLPSIYTEAEINHLLTSIDRRSPMGKRDYAILLLAARLGLRASDIAGLKFDNIIWDQNIISLKQQKTGRRLELPLLPVIGNAIIDYLKYGRIHSDSGHVFLKIQAPYTELNNASIYNITKRWLSYAGIKSPTPRKKGPHALRHSLASLLLDRKTPLPIITEVLGHQNTESTQAYLRIDLKALQQCALEVPPTHFHNREG